MEDFINNFNKVNNDLYATYFIYRIWIKYKDLVIYTSGEEEYIKVLKLLKIPEKYFTTDLIFPLSNYMFYDTKEEVDKAILSHFLKINQQFNKISNIELDNELLENNKKYKNFILYINENTNNISNIINSLKNKISLEYKTILINNFITK